MRSQHRPQPRSSRARVAARIPCRAVLLDAGGVIVTPDRRLVAGGLARVGIEIDAAAVQRAHYRAVQLLDGDRELGASGDAYLRALCSVLGVPDGRLSDAVLALSLLADRRASGAILWSEPTPNARRVIAALERAGIAVLVVTNSDGHAAENLRDALICQAGPGPGVAVTDVIDSAVVGSEKPDPEIFRTALARVGLEATEPTSVVHVGDMIRTDIAGARAAGIVPIHFDPRRACRAPDHRHIRSLNGIWRHVSREPSWTRR